MLPQINLKENKEKISPGSRVEFYRHSISEEDKQEVLKVLDSIFLTTGDVVSSFEQKLAAYVQASCAVGVMSCTHALELCLRYFDIKGGDEVITTPMSFVATSNAIEYVGARPVFVDVEETTGNIDATKIEQAITPKTKAIMPVHLYGQMCDMVAIKKIADRYHLKIIEDAAHCLEGERDGFKVGQLADAACFSFYATKNITSGEGGAISTNDADMYEWLLMARSHGINKDASSRYTKQYKHYDMSFLGTKSNMSNIQGALLLHQIDRIDILHEKRHALALAYDESLKALPGIGRPNTFSHLRHAHHLYTIWVAHEIRDSLLHFLQDQHIGVAVNYRPIHLMSYYRKKYGYQEGDFPIAEKIGAATISLPFYPNLSFKIVPDIVFLIHDFCVGKKGV